MNYTSLFPMIFGLVVVSIVGNVVFAQSSPFTPSQPQIKQPEIGVKITSPSDGQKIKIGEAIPINGSSTDNPTANCQVAVIVNNVKPYQNADAAGSGGKGDYSSWIFNLMSNYTTIKEGQNKITAKLSCINSPSNLTKWFSVNVTGTLG
jgi:hypothetical protein